MAVHIKTCTVGIPFPFIIHLALHETFVMVIGASDCDDSVL
jgi:hypothetical protein